MKTAAWRAFGLTVLGVLGSAGTTRADTVALWLFDEEDGVARQGLLWRAAERVPGKFGHALRPVASPGRPVAGARTGVNPTDTRLNLGAHDWTIECWLKLDREAGDEGVIFEIGAGPRGANELVTRFSVVPRENAFALTSLAPAGEGAIVARQVEYANPEGPPGGVAVLRSVTLTLSGAAWPRGRWCHVALVHSSLAGECRIFVDGVSRAVAAAKMIALPRSDHAYVSLGRDGAGGRVLAGAIDELRVSDHAVYATEFAPPGSFAVAPGAAAREERR